MTTDFVTIFQRILDGQMPDAESAPLLCELADRGETVEEIVIAARALAERAVAVGPFPDAIDVCGTGGDGMGTVNVSTAVALVAAACRLPVAKHGGRAASSRSGSSDVLEALGIPVPPTPEAALSQMERCGIAFLSAPLFNPAMARLGPLRRSLGRRTIFNLAGPLANPAGVRRQLLGVYPQEKLGIMAEAVRRLGSSRAWVVHGGGLDELTVAGPSDVAVVDPDGIRRMTIKPAHLGFASRAIADLKGGSPEQNASAMERLLAGEAGAYRDIVLLNSAAALVVGERAEALEEAIPLAAQAIDSGAASGLLAKLRMEGL